MRVRTSLLLAVLVGILGAVLRVGIPVAPVDAAFRDVIRFYDTLDLPAK